MLITVPCRGSRSGHHASPIDDAAGTSAAGKSKKQKQKGLSDSDDADGSMGDDERMSEEEKEEGSVADDQEDGRKGDSGPGATGNGNELRVRRSKMRN